MNQFIIRSAVCLLCLLFSSTSMSGTRQDVYRALDQISSSWPALSIEAQVNGQGSGAMLRVGDSIRYSLQSGQPGYFAMVHVDSHGTVTVIRPGTGQGASQQLDFPQGDVLIAQPPLGKETLFVVLSEQPIAGQAIGLPAGEEMVQRNDSAQLAAQFAAAVAESAQQSRVAIAKLEYYVEGAVGTTQYTTRGIVREFSDETVVPDAAPAQKPVQIALASPPPAEPVVKKTASKAAKKPEKRKAGKSLALQMLKFDFDSAKLTPEDKLNLDVFGEAFLSGNLESQKYVLAGHTDDLGSESYNQALSLRRAQAAQRYLIDMFGIAPERLQARGYGESRPKTPNVDAASRADNRRVEFEQVLR